MPVDHTRTSAILLAAGRSTRYGANKLLQSLNGEPLAHHAARTLSTIAFAHRVAVIGSTDLDLADFGFTTILAPPLAPMSGSIACGIEAIAGLDCDACLIALADMPLIPVRHFIALLDAHDDQVTATGNGALKTVPAIFSRAMFPALRALEGDRGAVGLLSAAPVVEAESRWMADVDTRFDLIRIQGGLNVS
jgi:molybdenum cofactor cytidylyltransferase